MKPHNQTELPDQGALFDVVLESSGTTDPFTPPVITAHFIEHPEGVFPEDIEPTELDVMALQATDLAGAVHSEIATRKRHQAQLGKHSPLQREEDTYLAARPGDVLPGFGVVTYRNLTEALAYAAQLETKRLAKGALTHGA